MCWDFNVYTRIEKNDTKKFEKNRKKFKKVLAFFLDSCIIDCVVPLSYEKHSSAIHGGVA